MSTPFDVAIVGLGAMGSAAAYQLARRGQRVVGIDRYAPPHAMGSSHGRTRMIREAYFEDPIYVPLVQRAYALWAELERAAGGRTLLVRTGGLMIGPEQGALVSGTLRSAQAHGLPHEVLDARALHRQYPAFSPLDDMVGIRDPRAGILLPEQIITAQLALAEHHGAQLRRDTVVHGWERTDQGLAIRAGDEVVTARQLVVAAGAWTSTLLGERIVPLRIERQVIHWFDPAQEPEYFTPDRMPVSMWELHNGSLFYTKPDLGDGVKIGMHHGGQDVNIDTIDRGISDLEDALIYDLLRRFVPFAKGHPRDRAVCMYTNTPDRHFIVDRHPSEPDVLILSPCSGHGFKFASVVGEFAADLVITGTSSFDLSCFALSRFAS
ncbi:MAG: N-methyl-L-tryptophan oxidase [Gemmatimonadaceae bacterium]|nr:N-methyl-L-tryptophan oxidase [Gemmatimonadaceae bacterium]